MGALAFFFQLHELWQRSRMHSGCILVLIKIIRGIVVVLEEAWPRSWHRILTTTCIWNSEFEKNETRNSLRMIWIWLMKLFFKTQVMQYLEYIAMRSKKRLRAYQELELVEVGCWPFFDLALGGHFDFVSFVTA